MQTQFLWAPLEQIYTVGIILMHEMTILPLIYCMRV